MTLHMIAIINKKSRHGMKQSIIQAIGSCFPFAFLSTELNITKCSLRLFQFAIDYNSSFVITKTHTRPSYLLLHYNRT